VTYIKYKQKVNKVKDFLGGEGSLVLTPPNALELLKQTIWTKEI
jgi:hypothetical protein